MAVLPKGLAASSPNAPDPGEHAHSSNGLSHSARPLSSLTTPSAVFIALLARGLWPVGIYPRGIRIPGRGDGLSQGKEPFGRQWGLERWTPDRWHTLVTKYPQAGCGICLGPGRGPDGKWLIDAEGDGPEAEESRARLFGGEVVATLGWGSARGGHQLFTADGGRLGTIVAKLKPFQVKAQNQPGVFHIPTLPGLELRMGGYKDDGVIKQLQSVVPPTPGTDGKPREWNGVETIADVPESFYVNLEAAVEAAVGDTDKPAPPTTPGKTRSGPSTNNADAWLKKALENGCGRIAMAQSGGRHPTLMAEVRTLAGYLHYWDEHRVGFDEAELIGGATEAADRAAPERKGDNRRCVEDAIANGKASPLELKDDLHRIAIGAVESKPSRNGTGAHHANGTASHEAALRVASEDTPPGDEDAAIALALHRRLARLPLTDLGNAERLAARHGRNMRYCHPWKSWFLWDGLRWRLDDKGEIRRLAKDSVRAILAESATLDDPGQRKSLAMHAIASEKRDRVAAMIFLCEVETGIPILHEEMDVDPWAFNCLNGTIDLRTGEIRPHRREDMLTKLCPFEYDPTAECPLWLATLDKFFHRPEPGKKAELIDYWQRLCGYAMTGVIRDHVMPVAYGTGSNGKSTLLGAMMDVFGADYSMKAPPDMFMAKKTDSHPTDRADLFRKRLVIVIETEAGRRLNETLVKELTGGDRIRARRMHENFWEFDPTHTLIMGTNHRPAVRGTDLGIWRRLKAVPFTVTVDDRHADKDMPAKLRAEGSGILAWYVRGCLEWQRRGLEAPAEVTEATCGYKAEQDIIGAFIDQCAILKTGLKAKSGDLYRRYKAWAEAGNEHAMSSTMFGIALGERGIASKTSNGVWYQGIGLVEETHTDGADREKGEI